LKKSVLLREITENSAPLILRMRTFRLTEVTAPVAQPSEKGAIATDYPRHVPPLIFTK